MKATRGESKRMFLELAALETDECVIWPYAKASQRGYGQVYIDGQKLYAHREALVRRTPPPDAKSVVRHGPCNRPACMNYRHLSWGTQAENNNDKLRDGTHSIGERNGWAKLTEDEVLELRRRYGNGERQRALAVEFGVTVMTVNRAIRGESWRHVA